MAVRHGYGKIAGTDALVFAYDTGDTRNSYKGKPTTNKLKNLSQNYSPQNETYFKVSYGTDTVNIPKLGTRTITYCDIYNDYNGGSGACCPNPFSYGTNISVSPSTTYMYQIIYKTTTGYANSNYMYRYEYSTSGYVTEAGVWSNTREEDLGDGWKHAWGSFTTNAATNSHINAYLFHYEYATQNRIQIAGVMLTEGSEVIPPNQFIGFEQTRSATQGLLDLTGNNSIDLSNVSFDSNAQMTFDGTNDYIAAGTSTDFYFDTGDFTLEAVFTPIDNGNAWTGVVNKGGSGAPGFAMSYYANGNGTMTLYMDIDAPDNTHYSSGLLTSGNTYHIVMVYDRDSAGYVYNNGTLTHTHTELTSQNQSVNFGRNLRLGTYDGTQWFMDGEIHIVKIYNRALTADEVRNNYRHYKTRFSI